MREIKFRIWLEKEKKYADTKDSIYVVAVLHNNELRVGCDMPEKELYDGFVLEQFTGLYDKNGKEIYEGDLVRVKATQTDDVRLYGNVFKEGIVRYDDEYPQFTLKANFMNFVNWAYNDEIEVIGNIHEGE